MSGRGTIVVGVSGGIAAYKSVSLIRLLVRAGFDVHVIPTQAALNFVGLPTFEAISRNPVTTSLFEGVSEVRHVALGQRADLIVIAPATAHTIASLAHGLADDLLGTTVLAASAPVVLAPAMHTEMWANPATKANVATLRERGTIIVGPAVGELTGMDSGVGRMSEPEEIAAVVEQVVHGGSGVGDLAGKHVLISAGGTREPLDPVRFLGNRSSGRQGVALAEAARARGARVTVVGANLDVPVPDGVDTVAVRTSDELRARMHEWADSADIVFMAAAVADFRPDVVGEQKVKKDDVGQTMTLRLVATPDILAELTSARKPDQIFVGFAAETEADREALAELGRRKIHSKGVDYLVANQVGWDRVFGTDSNDVLLLNHDGDIVLEASGTKLSVANRILDVVTRGAN